MQIIYARPSNCRHEGRRVCWLPVDHWVTSLSYIVVMFKHSEQCLAEARSVRVSLKGHSALLNTRPLLWLVTYESWMTGPPVTARQSMWEGVQYVWWYTIWSWFKHYPFMASSHCGTMLEAVTAETWKVSDSLRGYSRKHKNSVGEILGHSYKYKILLVRGSFPEKHNPFCKKYVTLNKGSGILILVRIRQP